MQIGSRILRQAAVIAIAVAGLAGCVAYPAPGYAPGYYGAPISGTVVIEGGGHGGGDHGGDRGGDHGDHGGDHH